VCDARRPRQQHTPPAPPGLPAPGEAAARAHGLIASPLPDVHGTDRRRFADRHVVVVGAGHSAANTWLDLADLAQHAPGTRISWAVRGADVSAVYGGEAQDELAARGALGTRLRHRVSTGAIEVHTEFVITGFAAGHNGLTV